MAVFNDKKAPKTVTTVSKQPVFNKRKESPGMFGRLGEKLIERADRVVTEDLPKVRPF
tara:strand:+ start:2736 stop:2909 length:174 start_codon:yes stop_codon:yes gene_type:complete